VLIGQHTWPILGELGYSDAQIDALLASGVARTG
jgi:crotonobetainyl-CoA:carnitine CoA-transferase CaiB-like acyl-CoA transferase